MAMFGKIARLNRKFERLDEAARKKARELKSRTASQEEFDAFTVPTWMQLTKVKDEILREQSKRIERKANRLGISVPPLDKKESWETGFRDNFGYHLTLTAQAQLRQAIREEQKARRDIWMQIVRELIVPLGGIVISILSLLVAYAALRVKH